MTIPFLNRDTTILRLAAASTCLALFGCGGGGDEPEPVFARPVTAFQLEESTPPPGRLIPGVVTPYRQTEIPFEVTGRVQRLIDIGDDVEGNQLDREGNLVRPGTIIAELDTDPFERALTQAEQRLESAKLDLEAQTVQLETVLPARIDSARSQAQAAKLNESYARDDVEASEAAVELANTTLERNRELLPTGAVSDIAVRQSEADLQAQVSRLAQARTLVTTREREHDVALAAIAELEGSLALQRATTDAQAALVKELEEAVKDAREDLEDCVLRAPFPGRVTNLHVGEGSYIQAGSAVMTLTMMNPIEAVISVSALVEDQLVVGSDAVIYPMNGSIVDTGEGIRATLYQKRGIANASTRTFEIGLLAPNKRRVLRGSRPGLPSVPYVIPIFENPLEVPGGSGLFTVAEAVQGTGSDAWVLKVRGLSQGGRSAETLQGTLQAERVPVRLGARTIQIASFYLVEILEPDTLQPGDLLVPSPTAEHEQGFVVDDNRWLLRPGDLVQVSVDHGNMPPGYYVPVQAIRELNGATNVFVIGDDDSVRAIPVDVSESSGEMRRIAGADLQGGMEIVSVGAHFLQDGDVVTRTGAAQ